MKTAKTYEDECREAEAKYRAGIETFKQNWPQQFQYSQPSFDEDRALAVRIYEANAWADLRHQNRGIGVVDHNRYETDRMSQILEACRETGSPWGQVILSALPYGCVADTDKLAAIVAEQRAKSAAAARETNDHCPFCSRDDGGKEPW